MTTLAQYVGVTVLALGGFCVLCAGLLLVWAAGEAAADRHRRRVEARSRERWVG